MAVPRSRQSNSRKNKRRSHHAKKPVSMAQCKNCGKDKAMHHICPYCGFYKGRAALPSAK